MVLASEFLPAELTVVAASMAEQTESMAPGLVSMVRGGLIHGVRGCFHGGGRADARQTDRVVGGSSGSDLRGLLQNFDYLFEWWGLKCINLPHLSIAIKSRSNVLGVFIICTTTLIST
jgi:hypothetical protein